MKKVISLLLACASVSLSAAQGKGTGPTVELYRYQDENGGIVIAHSIPPELVYKGYTVVNPDGTVLRVVPPQLTPKEIEERDRKEAEAKAQQAVRHHDDELQKLYATTQDIIDSRDRKLQSIDGAIATTRANIVRLKQQKQHLEAQAAQRERDGLLPSPEILQNLQILTTQIGDKEREVEMREIEKQQLREQFQRDLDRFQELFGPAPAPPTTEPAKATAALPATEPANTPVAAATDQTTKN